MNNHIRTIVFICENDLTQQIGGTIHVQQIINALKKYTPDILLIAPDYHHKGINDLGVKTITIKTPKTRVLKWLYYYFLSTLVIFRLSLQQKIIVYSREMPYNLFLPLICKLFNIPLFIELNGVFLSEMKDLGYSRSSYIFSRLIEKLVLSSAQKITCVSDEIKYTVSAELKIPEKAFVTIPNGTDINSFYPKNKIESRKTLELPEENFIIGFIGSCYPYHDIDTLIRTVPRLIKNIPQLHIVIVGDGFMLEDWKKLSGSLKLTNHVNFIGYVPFEMANDYINSLDICFAGYKQNTFGFPMKILDYMACNKPVISSRIPAITKYFHESNTFKIVNPENIDLLKNAITDLYQIRNQEIKTHREFVLNNYTWDHTARKIINTIENLEF